MEFNLKECNERYSGLSVYQRVEQLYKEFDAKDIMLTSSFAATSAFLLKVFSDINKDQLIYFIDTGYHFKETLIYKEYLTQLYDLNVVNIVAKEEDHQLTLENEMWKKSPNKCCQINKVDPLSLIKKDYKIWVSGLMKWQSDFRDSLNIFEQRENIIKFYPLLDIDFIGRDEFISKHHLPFHPLKSKGYSSIGCKHCTTPGDDRSGRWNNAPKTECGLHL
ncbi:MAG: phosphoadenosine phosphosulfate reductase [Sediminicola sp.]|jgi:phosphoadenosine phosphosulfate reductase